MINITVRGHDFEEVDTIETLAKKAQADNIHSLQLALTKSFPDLVEKNTRLSTGLGYKFKNTLQAHQVDVGILSCYSNLIHPDTKEREKIIATFCDYLKNARYFGAPMVASETGSVLPQMGFTEENFKEDVFQELIEVVKELVACGEHYQTIVGIEPGTHHPLHTIEKTKRLLEAVPSDYLGIVYDSTNLITADTYKDQVDMTEAVFKELGDKIVAFHLKDYLVEDHKIKPVPLGEGVIDYKKIIAIVEKYCPGCFVVLEQTKDPYMKRAVEWLEG